MKRLGLLTIGLAFYAVLSQAQPKDLPVSLDSLRQIYPLFTHAWQYHAGDDVRWASPTFDDQSWLTYKPYFERADAPPDWKGIGWFRLHIDIDSLPDNQLLSVLINQVGASEVYVDGVRIGGFGTIGHSATTGTDYTSRSASIIFRLNKPGHHLLAVRLATFRSYIFRWVQYQQGFRCWLTTDVEAVTYVTDSTRIWSLNLLSILVPGWFGLLHLFLFLFYPARRSNFYYGLMLLIFAGTSACVYFDQSVTNPVTLQAMAYSFWLGNIGFSILAVVFIYSVCYTTSSRLIWLFYSLALLASIAIAFTYAINNIPWVFGFVFLCYLEVIRVVLLASLRRQPGVWLIGVGLIAVALGIFVGSSDVFGIWHNNPWGENLFLTFCFLTLPLCTSLYLARDFAQTSLALTERLKQVEELSAQTRAQEAEKLKLIAGQNEQLEQTVRERTIQLQQQTDKLKELDAFKSRFFTNLTHEFRTPLTLILGPAEQVLTQTKEPQTRQQVGLIQRSGSRLLRLINQLLDLSKLEAGKMPLTTTPGDLISLVRGTLQSFGSMAQQKGVTLQFTAMQERLTMYIDRDKLEKILYNLLSNALKFTPSGGTVSVSLTSDELIPEGWIQLAVQDTGVGISMVKQPYIFDRFYQADASDTREQEGTGIGLALTKELVDLHGGTIQLSSQEGVGTLVVVRLPMKAASFAEEVTEQPISTNQLISLPVELVAELEDAPLILLIEDNDDVRAFIRSSLSGQNGINQYRIIEAPNGEVGVQLAQQQVPDLVITDLMMPKMDGYTVCKTIKQDERTSHIPIIMLTARADLDSKLEGLETGADAYLAKPFSQRELIAHVTNLITLRQQLRERYRLASLHPENQGSTARMALPSMERVFLDRVRAAIDEHLADEQYSVDLLSDEMALSRAQLHRKLKALINQSPGDLIRLIRLQRAHDLLSANVGTIAEVAYQVGFGSPTSFSTSFSRQYGYTPSEVKKK